MGTPAAHDYTVLDRPEILQYLFHPRPEPDLYGTARPGIDLMIPVAPPQAVGARFHEAGPTAPTILFFHGNGEIVADYDDLAEVYLARQINFLAADYRGYGRSTGQPTVSAMMHDSHVIFEYAAGWLKARGCTGPLIVMGRSLGSAPALEIAAHHPQHIDGLIVESGLAFTGPLLRLLGIDLRVIAFSEIDGFRNLRLIRDVAQPVLIIHGERDHIIPFADGQALYDACRAPDKTLLTIRGANHNDLFLRGMSEYMTAVAALAHP